MLMAPKLKDPLAIDRCWATKAARNNAEWCDFVCCSHGAPGEFYDNIWINRHTTPRFYPNAVTLSSSQSTSQYEIIGALIKIGIPGDWAVKDSFDTLDLASGGFHELMRGEWIHRPTSEIPEIRIPGISWQKIEEVADLRAWENAWRGNSQEESSIFMPRLLEEERIAFIAAFQGNRIVAGCIANRSEDGVGISNIFLQNETPSEFRAGSVVEVFRWSAGLPLMGSESGNDLVAMRSLGFESVGRLKVWLRQSTQSV
jgi:hypothetical protein